MNKKANPLLEKLAAQRQGDMADVPPVMAAMETPPAAPAKSTRPTKPVAVADGNRDRFGVSLGAAPLDALRRLQAAILAGGGQSASASGVIAAALEFAAADLPRSAARLVEFYAGQANSDRRRRHSA